MYFLTSRVIIRIRQKNFQNFLHRLVTADVSGLKDGGFVFSTLLNAKGRFLYDFFIYKVNDDILIDIDRNEGLNFINTIKQYDLLLEFNFAIEDNLKIFADDEFLKNLKAGIFKGRYIKDVILDGNKSEEEYNLERIKLQIPDGFLNLTKERSIILEYGYDFLNAISFDKGCYIGQELMNRTKRIGEVRKALYCLISDVKTLNKGEVLGEDDGVVVESLFNHNLILGKKLAFEGKKEYDGFLVL